MPADTIGVAKLSGPEHKRLETKHPELRRGQDALVISASAEVLSAVQGMVEHLTWEREQSEDILEVLTRDVGSRVLHPSRLLQLHLQAEAREDFLRTRDCLTSAEVSKIGGSTARNTAALANRWKGEGKIFAVNVSGTDFFPAFQFGEDGRPVAAVAEIIRSFEGESEWGLPLWFASPSGWLDGRTPAEVLEADPAAVIEAARRATAPLDV